MPEQNIVVSVKNLEKSFGGRKVLEDITFDVYKGETFVIMGGSFFLIGQAISICIIVSGRYINQTKGYMFSFITACMMCISFPFGTALGIFTIIVLSRDSVKKRYDDQKLFEA